MLAFQENQKVSQVDTKYRKIKTAIPTPTYLAVMKDLETVEARSMHGQLPICWDHAEDFLVYDKEGNCWIDFTSTIFVTNSGHSNSRIIEAIKKQLDQQLIHTYTFIHEIRAKFLKKLIEVTPDFCEKAFLLSAGTEATECALKLMRMYGQKINPKKVDVISFKGNMHGRTMGAEMLKGDEKSCAWIGHNDPHIHHLPFPYPWTAQSNAVSYDWAKRFKKDLDLLKEKNINFDNICGFMIEPYQGWGAVLFPEEYIQELFSFAKRHNILITVDEIQGGFGRSGKQFVYQHYDIKPDLLCLGKALSGSLPLSAVIGRKDLLDLPDIGSMSSTHSANPLSCAAALANLEEIESKDLVKESARKGKIFHEKLNNLKREFPDYISYVLGEGLLAALIITNPKTHQPDGALATEICHKALRKGLLLVHTGRESIKMGPPLTIADEALLEGLSVLEEIFNEFKRA